jgi:hypothetical protein
LFAQFKMKKKRKAKKVIKVGHQVDVSITSIVYNFTITHPAIVIEVDELREMSKILWVGKKPCAGRGIFGGRKKKYPPIMWISNDKLFVVNTRNGEQK